MPHRVCVIGAITEDLLVAVRDTPQRVSTYRGPGGILHSCVALAAHGVSTSMITAVDAPLRDSIQQRLGDLVNLDAAAVQVTSYPVPKCNLFWAPDSFEPVEMTVTQGEPIPTHHILSALGNPDEDLIYVNLTVGHDIEVDALLQFAQMGYRVYLDAHMLMYRRDFIGCRSLSPPPDIVRWLTSADVVQMNATELKSLVLSLGVDVPCREDSVEIVWSALLANHSRPLALVVTGRDHIELAVRTSRGVAKHCYPVETAEPLSPIHTVGCGDVFGAGLVSQCLEGWSSASIEQGIRIGAEWARFALAGTGIPGWYP